MLSAVRTWVGTLVAGVEGARHRPSLVRLLPEPWAHVPFLGLELWQWLGVLFTLSAAVLTALLMQRVLLGVLGRVVRLTGLGWIDGVVGAARGPLFLVVWTVCVAAGTRWSRVSGEAQEVFDLVVRSTFIASIAWFLLRLIAFSARYVEGNLSGPSLDIRARGLQTQLVVLRRVIEVSIYVLTAALLLMQFSVVRTVGVSLLASAGIAGLVVGLAAQKSIGNLLAGIQLSVTQPIRLGDSVVVEGEVGTVQEITLTYVVIRVWDLRRLVVPINYFLEKPFQNWSRQVTEMLGTFNLYVDYEADVNAFRQELVRLLQGDAAIRAKWNGATQALAVTDVSERTLTLRILVSASDAGTNFDLRCLLREGMVTFLKAHPEWMPRLRSEVESEEGPAAQAALPG